MKIVIGLGLAFAFGNEISLPVGILFFGWVLVEALIEKN